MVKAELVPIEHVEHVIRIVRGHRVMLDADLASLYAVSVKALNQAVARNRARFPEDFMFQLSADEYAFLRSQIVTSKPERRGGRRTRPYAFTEQGVAMLSSVLRSPRAVQVNIEIMRAFVRLSDSFLAEVRGMKYKNLAVEVLRKLLANEVKTRARHNLVQSRSFAALLEDSIRRYQNRAIEAAQVIEELLGLAGKCVMRVNAEKSCT